jgi:hypothetical protein
VASVVKEGARSRSVYLPEGAWYDVWSGEVVTGPTRVEVEAPLERIPVFVRAGAVVPTGPTMHYVGERPRDPLTLHVYPPGGSEEHTSLLYEDDGRTYGFQEGKYLLTRFTLRVAQGSTERLHLLRETEGSYQPEYESIEVVVHGVTRLPESVTVDGSPAGVGRVDESGHAPSAKGRGLRGSANCVGQVTGTYRVSCWTEDQWQKRRSLSMTFQRKCRSPWTRTRPLPGRFSNCSRWTRVRRQDADCRPLRARVGRGDRHLRDVVSKAQSVPEATTSVRHVASQGPVTVSGKERAS